MGSATSKRRSPRKTATLLAEPTEDGQVDPEYLAWLSVGLDSEQQNRLIKAGIPLGLAVECDLATVEHPAQLERAGFSPNLPLPGLLIPFWDVDGEVAFHQYRPDEPDDPKRRYEVPYGTELTLYVPPRCRPGLFDATRRLWLAESPLKALAISAREEIAVGYVGNYGWHPLEAQEVLGRIPMTDRQVIIPADSNIETNPEVFRAYREFRSALRREHRAHAVVLQVPLTVNGVDDWLGADKSADDLLELPEFDFSPTHKSNPDRQKVKEREEIRANVLAELRAAAFEPPDAPPNLAEAIRLRPPKVTMAITDLHLEGGNTIFVGPRKIGKTTLAGNVIRALADGEPFLNRQVMPLPPGESLVVLNYEMGSDQWARWITDMGVKNLDRIYHVPLRGKRLPLTRPEALAWLAEYVAAVNGHWVVLDSWRRAMADCGLNENSPPDVNVWTGYWDEFLGTSGAANSLLVVHSSFKRRKEAGTEDDLEFARGGSSLEDWADFIWRIRAEDETRFFSAMGRDVEVPETALTYNPVNRIYGWGHGSRAEVRMEKDVDQVSLVVAQKPGINKTDLRDELGWSHPRADRAIRQAAREESIRIASGDKTAQLHYPVERDRRVKLAPEDAG